MTVRDGCDALARVPSGTNGISAPDGDGIDAVVTETGSRPFTNFGGYSREFVTGSQAIVKVYLDKAWTANPSFQYTVAANGAEGNHQRDFGFQVRATGYGTIEIGVSPGAMQTQITAPIANATIFNTSGWYTLQQIICNVNGVLSVDMNLIAADGAIKDGTLTNLEDLIGGPTGQVRDNRYGLLTDVSIVGGLSIDALQLGDFEDRAAEAATNASNTGVIPFADVELMDTHPISAVGNGTGYCGTFKPMITGDSAGDGQVAAGWSFTATAGQLDNLAVVRSVTQTTTTLLDYNGATSSKTVSVVLTGTNDGPAAFADTGRVDMGVTARATSRATGARQRYRHRSERQGPAGRLRGTRGNEWHQHRRRPKGRP